MKTIQWLPLKIFRTFLKRKRFMRTCTCSFWTYIYDNIFLLLSNNFMVQFEHFIFSSICKTSTCNYHSEQAILCKLLNNLFSTEAFVFSDLCVNCKIFTRNTNEGKITLKVLKVSVDDFMICTHNMKICCLFF